MENSVKFGYLGKKVEKKIQFKLTDFGNLVHLQKVFESNRQKDIDSCFTHKNKINFLPRYRIGRVFPTLYIL